jgi:predicted RNA-binding protein YlxR (DUF448 family)
MTAAVAMPERTCLGCRARRPQPELVRLASRDGRVVPAWPGAPGRGAYLCPREECLEAAEKKRAFARAFRGPVIMDPAVLREVARRAAARCSSSAPFGSEPAAAIRKVVR